MFKELTEEEPGYISERAEEDKQQARAGLSIPATHHQ